MCRKPFNSLGRRICNSCLEQIDKDFITVRDYIYEHKQTNMDKVSDETGVSKQHILYLLKEGRLILDDETGAGGFLLCESCKKPIKTGRLCDNCTKNVSSKMQKSVESHKPAAAAQDHEHDNFKASAKLQNK